jgi:hypothetical protein
MSLPRNSLRHRRGALVAGAAGAAGAALALTACAAGTPAKAFAAGSPGTAFAAASRSSASPMGATELTREYGYVGPHTQTLIVPGGVTMAEVRVIGGKGGRTGAALGGVAGGDGAQVSGLFKVHTGEDLTFYVAGYGGDGDGNSNPGAGGWGATGYGGRGGGAAGWNPDDGAGGGGASAIRTGSTVIALAGGGGGGGGMGLDISVDNGGTGGSSGESGADPGIDGHGFGGGAGGQGAAIGTGAGGGGGTVSTHAGGGGGGGAGQAGGAGGGAGGIGGGGGGGGGAGSSYYSPLLMAAKVTRGGTDDGNGRIFLDLRWQPEPSMVLSASATQVEQDQPPVFTVRMSADATGSVSFYNLSLPASGRDIGVAPIVDGTATLPTPARALLVGRNDIWASYAGDLTYAPRNSNQVRVTATKPRPSMVLSASTTQVEEGQPAPVFTLRMPADATGDAGFYNLSLPGPDKGMGVAPIIDGVATLRTPTRALLVGQNDIQASYLGNDKYAAHDSNTVTVTVSSP